MIQALDWDKNVDPKNPRQFLFDGITLADFAKQIEDRLKIRSMRVVGDPRLKVQRWLVTGVMPEAPRPFARPDLDVLLIGEAREWELIEYAADTITSAEKERA